MCWLRYYKRLDLICTEDPMRSADILGTDSSIQCRTMIEIETKISIADLKADLKKTHNSMQVVDGKHERLQKAMRKERLIYENVSKSGFRMGTDKDQVHGVEWTDTEHSALPSQFYFMVPEGLSVEALEIITKLYPHAGLMVGRPFKSGYFTTSHVSVVKRAPVLHRLLISKGVKGQISARMTSEICKLRLDAMMRKWHDSKTTPEGT